MFVSAGVPSANAGLGWSGRTLGELSREFEPTAQSIINWVGLVERDTDERCDGPNSAEREVLTRLRRENIACGRSAIGSSPMANTWLARGHPCPPS